MISDNIITKYVGFDIWLVLYICTIYCTYDKSSYSFEVELILAIMSLYRAYSTLAHLRVSFVCTCSLWLLFWCRIKILSPEKKVWHMFEKIEVGKRVIAICKTYHGPCVVERK